MLLAYYLNSVIKYFILFFCAMLHSTAAPNEVQIRTAFDAFKISPACAATLALGPCSSSIAFLEKLNHDFRYELDDAKRTQYIQMIEQILYHGTGVGGLLGRACNARECAIMTEAAFLLELWYQNQGQEKYFIQKNLAHPNALIQKHYLILKYISIVASRMFDVRGSKRFFKDALPEIVRDITAFDPDMTEEKFLKIPICSQVDVLIANLSASLCFYERGWNRAEDYLDLEDEDGLNALRADMRELMNAETTEDATRAVDALEARCWGLPLEILEAEDKQKRDLIGRAFAAVERIKSVNLDPRTTLFTKDPRAAEDKFSTIAVPSDAEPAVNASTLKKQTLLLLISMALQERFYNPLYTREDIKKIILAKLQQSNYWEVEAPLLAGKTDLAPYPTELPLYADAAIGMVEYIDTVPKVYKLFVDNVRQQAVGKKGSGYSYGNNIHYVGGNTFLHLASLGDGQCGFFSMGLIDDALVPYQRTNSNARQKFLEILANSLDPQTLYDTASMSGVIDWIQKYVEGEVAVLNGPSREALVPLLQTLDRGRINEELVPLRTAVTQENTRIRDKYGMQETADGSFVYEDNSTIRLQREQVALSAADYTLLLEKIKREDGIKEEVKLNRDTYHIGACRVYTNHLRQLLLTNPEARRAFSVHVVQALAGKLLPQEQPVISFERILSSMECQRLDLQLLFSPGSARYVDVAAPENRMIPLPTQTIAEAFGVNMQVITTPEVAQQGFLFIDLAADPSRAFSSGLYVLQDILVSPSAKNMIIWNFGGGHYEKLVPLSDPVSLARALRHLNWIEMGHVMQRMAQSDVGAYLKSLLTPMASVSNA